MLPPRSVGFLMTIPRQRIAGGHDTSGDGAPGAGTVALLSGANRVVQGLPDLLASAATGRTIYVLLGID